MRCYPTEPPDVRHPRYHANSASCWQGQPVVGVGLRSRIVAGIPGNMGTCLKFRDSGFKPVLSTMGLLCYKI